MWRPSVACGPAGISHQLLDARHRIVASVCRVHAPAQVFAIGERQERKMTEPVAPAETPSHSRERNARPRIHDGPGNQRNGKALPTHTLNFAMYRCIRNVLVAIVVLGSAIDAQVAHPGIGVRVRAPSVLFDRFQGVYLGRSSDTLFFGNDERGPVKVPASAITSLDVSRGKSRWRGALVGALWGAGIGLLVGSIADTDTSDLSKGEAIGYLAVGGAEIGAIIGAIVGRHVWVQAQPAVLMGAAAVRPRPAWRVALRVR